MNLEKILNEIYEIDANLREHDEKLRKAVELMLSSRPQINVDENFEKKLREDLMNYALTLQNKKTKFILNFHSMKKFLYALGGVALAALVIVPLVYQHNNPAPEFVPSTEFDLEGININDDAEDFDLNLDQGFDGDMVAEESVRTLSGGGVAEVAVDKASSYYIPSYDNEYTYKYVGEDFALPNAQLPVLRANGAQNQIAMAEVLDNFNLDALDLNKFTNLNVDNITLNEDKEQGYQVYINLTNQTVNVHRNWDKWVEPEEYAIDPEDVKEEQIIALANDFMQKYGIDLTNYAPAELQEDWEVLLTYDYRPESYNVIYPLLVDGKKIVSSWGDVSGLNANVDLEYGMVSSLYGLSTETYEGKNYDAVQNFSAVQSYIEDMGYDKLSFEDEADVLTAEVQTPELVWMEYSSYNGQKTTNYLVPALRFDVKYPEDTRWNRNDIIVPLVKDMFERMAQ